MNDSSREQIINYIEKASVAILGILFILFPVLFTNITTDLFVLPKQALLVFVTMSLLLLYGVRTFLSQSLRIKRTPFDLPILIFIFAALMSVIFSVAKYDSLYNFVPLLFAALSYFTITYNVRNQKSLGVLILSLLTGGAIVSLISLFSFLKVYVFTFDFSKVQTFTTLGSVLDQAIYLGILLSVGLYYLYPFIKNGKKALLHTQKDNLARLLSLGITSILIAVGLIVSLYMLIGLQKPIILPLATGFQTAFAAISQDPGRTLQGLLFGTGFGEFSIAFLRFKQAAFNANTDIWNLTFFRSSSYLLELLATTGLAGLLAFLFIIYRALKERPLFIPLVLLLVASIILPFGFYHLVLIFFVLGIYSSMKSLSNNDNYFEVELQLVASKKGFFVLSTEETTSKNSEKYGKILSSIVLGLIVLLTLVFGLLSFDYLVNNVTFQKSLAAAAQNNGSLTYQHQSNVLNSLTGKYTDAYYRVYSQTNLALANGLASSIPQGSSPSAQTSQTITTLVQQSINAARSATTISPSNSLNWQNLSSIYRALIGFGQNADSFAVLAAQQALQLDPTNPQEYINLGGLYYQLKAYDKALEQFQLAINLKSDLPNAYYNHAHALLQKGDLKNALAELQAVKPLIANDKTNLDKLNKEIKDLEAQIAGTNNSTNINPSLNNTEPQTVLPTQNPPVKIPAPQTVSPTPTPKASPTPTVEALPTSSETITPAP